MIYLLCGHKASFKMSQAICKKNKIEDEESLGLKILCKRRQGRLDSLHLGFLAYLKTSHFKLFSEFISVHLANL